MTMPLIVHALNPRGLLPPADPEGLPVRMSVPVPALEFAVPEAGLLRAVPAPPPVSVPPVEVPPVGEVLLVKFVPPALVVPPTAPVPAVFPPVVVTGPVVPVALPFPVPFAAL